MKKVGISGIAYYLPKLKRTSSATEHLINQSSNVIVPSGLIQRITGVETRYVASETEYNSTLAIEACRKLFNQSKVKPSEIDLLIFASTGQDILEPATAHPVQAEIGTQCPVIDVKNACNSFLNALEIATCFIQIGKYQNVLIATGEVPTKSVKYCISSRSDLKLSFPGYVFGDAGTAVLVNKQASMATIKNSYFFAESKDWDIAMFPGGGSRFFGSPDAYFFQGDGTRLVKPFFKHTERLLKDFLKENSITIKDIDRFFVHQITGPYLEQLCSKLQIPMSKIEVTIKDYGNVAAASIPLGIALGLNTTPTNKGSVGLLVGLAGGMSIGFTLLEF